MGLELNVHIYIYIYIYYIKNKINLGASVKEQGASFIFLNYKNTPIQFEKT